MSVSRLVPQSSGGNDFSLLVAGTYTSASLTKEYPAGNYQISSTLGDNTFDIYLLNADGSSAGYTNQAAISATKNFNKVIILGGSTGDSLNFAFKNVYSATNATGETGAGPVATSVSPSSVPKANDTFTLTGRNFASDVQVAFTGTGYSSTQAKSIVRTDATSLIVTRPDNLPVSGSPYTLTVTNPGVTAPTGTNSHILLNAITAGSSPVWTTTSPLPSFTRNSAYSTTLVATDADAGSAITYSVVSGSLPSDFSLDGSTGVLSGTTTSSSPASFTIRATDAGGNFVDASFSLPNVGPTWTTAAGALPNAPINTAYSTTIVATDDSGTAPTYTVASGSLPSGLSLNGTTGVISGTPTVWSNQTPSSFTINATDANGVSAARTFTILVTQLTTFTFTSSGSWTAPAGVTSVGMFLAAGGGHGGSGGNNYGGGGGGGGGRYYNASLSVTPGTTYTYSIGGANSNSSWNGGALVCGYGGNGGGGNSGTAGQAGGAGSGGGSQGAGGGGKSSGGAGGAGVQPGGSSSSMGGPGANQVGSSAGGGATGAGQGANSSTGNGNTYGGAGVNYFGLGGMCGGGGGGANGTGGGVDGGGNGNASSSAGFSATNYGGGGGGGGWQGGGGGSGGNGVLALQYQA